MFPFGLNIMSCTPKPTPFASAVGGCARSWSSSNEEPEIFLDAANGGNMSQIKTRNLFIEGQGLMPLVKEYASHTSCQGEAELPHEFISLSSKRDRVAV
jgi:hypothetical protein